MRFEAALIGGLVISGGGLPTAAITPLTQRARSRSDRRSAHAMSSPAATPASCFGSARDLQESPQCRIKWASLRRCGISSGIFFVLGQRGDLRQRHARPARLGKTGQRHVGQAVGHRARLRWYGPPPCAAAHHVSKQAPVTQHALPKRFGFGIASHGAPLAGPGACASPS